MGEVHVASIRLKAAALNDFGVVGDQPWTHRLADGSAFWAALQGDDFAVRHALCAVRIVLPELASKSAVDHLVRTPSRRQRVLTRALTGMDQAGDLHDVLGQCAH